MIMTSLAMTFQAAFDVVQARLTQPICLRPRKSRGWFQSAQGGATASSQGWLARYWRWSMIDQVDGLAEVQRAVDAAAVPA